jgi:hypothetical protein
MRHGLLIVTALAISGCPAPSDDDAPSKCPGLYLGDPTAEPQLEIIYLDAAAETQDLGSGAVPLIFPPQGGRVLFVGARATNVDPCAATLTGAIRDPTSKKVQLDKRTVNLTPTASGWGESAEGDAASFANVPACPNQWSDTDLFGGSYELTVALETKDGKSITKTATITPFCGEPENEAQCRCICKKGYVLGEACGAP